MRLRQKNGGLLFGPLCEIEIKSAFKSVLQFARNAQIKHKHKKIPQTPGLWDSTGYVVQFLIRPPGTIVPEGLIFYP